MRETVAFYGTLKKKKKNYGWPRRNGWFCTRDSPLLFNCISYYISNLITWWNVTPVSQVSRQNLVGKKETPAGLPGYRWVDGGAQPLASFHRKPRPPLQQLTSSRELSGAIRAWSPPVGANAGSVWGHRGQYHISVWPSQKNRPLCLLAQPEGSRIGKALIWTMGTLSALNPRYPPPPTSFPLKLMRCNFTYMMGNSGLRMTAVAEPLFAAYGESSSCVLQSRTLFNLTVPACNLIKPTSRYHIALFTATLWALFFLTFFTKLLCSSRKDDYFFFFFLTM